MGQSKGSGYTQQSTVPPEVATFLQQMLSQAGPNQNAAAEGFKGFLPGGDAGKAITNQANQNFQQQSIPSILNAFGTGNKGSSSLNQALASGGAKLNTDLASQLAQMQLQAASGIGALGNALAGIGTQPQTALTQTPQPLWQQGLLAALGIGGNLGGAYLGAPRTNINWNGNGV